MPNPARSARRQGKSSPIGYIAAVLLGGALLIGPADQARAQWTVQPLASQDGTATGHIATVMANTGDAQLQIGCAPDGTQFISIEYLGYDSGSDALNIRYRVDGRNAIDARWPRQPSFNSLLATNANPVFVTEFTDRATRGWTLRVAVEVLPELVFRLRGSQAAIEEMQLACEREARLREQPPLGEGADGESDAAASEDGSANEPEVRP